MGTYCADQDLILDNGKAVDTLFDVSATNVVKLKRKQMARERCFNRINDDYLSGRTVVPAKHIPSLREIEKDLVMSIFLDSAYTTESMNVSEQARVFEDRAIKMLDNLRFGASVEDPIADDENTGDGKISQIEVKDEFTRTETWVLQATSALQFYVRGSKSGTLRNLDVAERYPQKDWGFSVSDYGLSAKYRSDMRFEEYPISFTIEVGSTAFVKNDKFIFRTYAASFYKRKHGEIIRA